MGSNALQWAQLVVLVLTGAIVGWYTYETHVIRLETSQQAAVTPSAKLWDRQNDLDRLALLNPKMAMQFMAMANRTEPYFRAPLTDVARDEIYCQLKAFVYLQLNFFEEIYLTTSASSSVARQFEREQWNQFIFCYMRHALLREVFGMEKDSAYTGEFVNFLTENRNSWAEKTADNELF